MDIAEKERSKYSTVWSAVDNYADVSPGERAVPLLMHMLKEIGVEQDVNKVLDAGCGSGKGAVALAKAGFYVELCDLTSEGLVEEARDFPFVEQVLWKMNLSHSDFDLAYCCDVFEHIPTQFTALVARELLATAPLVFIALSNVPDNFGAWVGESLHQTVQPFTWWRDLFREVGDVVDARDLHDSSVFLLKRRDHEGS